MRWRATGVVGAAALLMLAGLGSTDLWAPDEPRYAQIAEELRTLERGPEDLVLLRLAGEPYTQKPPLYFWLAALAGSPTGKVTEWAARLPSALAGIATVAVTLLLGFRLFGRSAGLWGASLLLTSFSFARLARRAQLDVLLTLFETLVLLAFWRLESKRGSRTKNLAILHVALGLGILTKGPVALLPVLAIGAYLWWEGRAGELRGLLAPRWLCVSLAPGLFWLACAVALGPSGFFGDAVGENLFGRFFAGTSHARPFYYFAIRFPLDFLPWTLLWPAVWFSFRREAGRHSWGVQGRAWRLLVAWISVFVAFFSLSAAKRGLYLLPAFPAVALLCGASLDATLRGRVRLPTAVSGALTAAWLALLGFGAWLCTQNGIELRSAPGFALPSSFGATLFAIGVAGGLAWIGCARSRPTRRAALVLTMAYGIELALFCQLYPGFDVEKSPRPIARAATRWSSPTERIGVFSNRALVGGIAYYGDRPVAHLPTLDSVGSFLSSGGGAIVVKRRDLDRLRAVIPVEIRAASRSGRRELLVVTAESPRAP